MDEECADYAAARASALLNIAISISDVRDRDARKAMLRAMDLLNEGIEQIVRPRVKQRPAPLLPLSGGQD